jgi:hypothetical protein
MNTARTITAKGRSPKHRRGGMTVIVVLGVISITLALSYAMLRSQVTSVAIQSNLERNNAARQAAYAGVSAALRAMHKISWGGIDVPLTQNLADNQWFDVAFETGDPSLTSSSSDYAEFPYRVTINSTGFASDPAQPDVRSTYKVRAVVQLIRKKLTDAPAVWNTIRQYTTYQWSGNVGFVEFPVQVSGPVWTQNQLVFSSDYPTDAGSRTLYLSDLNGLRLAGFGDHRPFTGPINTPHSKQGATTLSLMQTNLGLTVNNIATATGQPFAFPTSTSSYQLYPGGKTYNIPVIQSTYGDTLANITLAGDPVNNPLGIFLSNEVLQLSNNVTVQGTIVAAGGAEPDIRILGDNVSLAGPTLAPLEGSSSAYRLPAAVVKDDFSIYNSASATIRGAVVVWDEFGIVKGDSDVSLDMKGLLASSRMNLNGRAAWDLALATWQLERTLFDAQKLLLGGIRYYPQWMKNRYLMNHQPLITIQPDVATTVDHWHVWGQPVYCRHPDDPGLRWDVVGWTDNPH